MEKEKCGVSVRENGTCAHWEADGLPGMAILRECWFCRWANFRTDPDVYRHTGICRDPERKEIGEEEE